MPDPTRAQIAAAEQAVGYSESWDRFHPGTEPDPDTARLIARLVRVAGPVAMAEAFDRWEERKRLD